MSTKEFTRRVFSYIKQVNRDKDLPSAAVRVGLVIADHWNEKDGDAHPSLLTIALESGLADGTVRRMLPHLIERGHLAIKVGSRGSGHPNHYQPLEKSANGGVIKTANGGAIESANGGAIAEKPKAPFSRIKAPFKAKKAPTGALNTLEHTEHTKRAPSARSAADADSQSVITTSVDAPLNPAFSTSNDAPISEPDTPVPRAPDGARIQPADKQQPPPSRDNPIGAAANGANGHAVADASPFAQVLRIYPVDRVGNEAKAYFAFARALDVLGDLDAVLEGIADLMEERGADMPDLADALAAIECMQ